MAAQDAERAAEDRNRPAGSLTERLAVPPPSPENRAGEAPPRRNEARGNTRGAARYHNSGPPLKTVVSGLSASLSAVPRGGGVMEPSKLAQAMNPNDPRRHWRGPGRRRLNEDADDYPAVVARLNEGWRVIVCTCRRMSSSRQAAVPAGQLAAAATRLRQPLNGRPTSILIAVLDDLPDDGADVLRPRSRRTVARGPSLDPAECLPPICGALCSATSSLRREYSAVCRTLCNARHCYRGAAGRRPGKETAPYSGSAARGRD